MDFGRTWPGDGRRILGPSKSWSGFICGTLFPLPIGLLQTWLVLIAPPSLKLVPAFGSTLADAVPVLLLLTGGALVGDAIGSFIKRRLGIGSGQRAILLDQLTFVIVPVALGVLLVPAVFLAAIGGLEAVLWLLLFTVGLHVAFNYVGYWLGLKSVPW